MGGESELFTAPAAGRGPIRITYGPDRVAAVRPLPEVIWNRRCCCTLYFSGGSAPPSAPPRRPCRSAPLIQGTRSSFLPCVHSERPGCCACCTWVVSAVRSATKVKLEYVPPTHPKAQPHRVLERTTSMVEGQQVRVRRRGPAAAPSRRCQSAEPLESRELIASARAKRTV